ncbi:hypothetical protein NIES4072_31330 [Nostoc commune NIES-4072]|uniref:Uncharacterized protein n=1 Tax=Nostoc commune NIES-4072 TaxID=2005467 RepID=A0A2R5FMG1_NOSCO|nr:hypothetical protein [Nostoc commune]BBD69534.1 hypothetical protein NIES4070_59430 [Nostoc commune HK-02]GBG19465.1 hypothetical protein NIES4072_31330 [Nostoc commune NIES-4072]
MAFIGYTTNLGVNKYLASVKYTEAGLRKYLLKSNEIKEPVAITNPISNGDEFYLGNGLWESNSGAPTRNMIHDLEIHSFPVNFTSTPLYDPYGQSLTYNQVSAYADTWTPENPNSQFTFTRSLINVINDEVSEFDKFKGLGISYYGISSVTDSISFIYPDDSYTFLPSGVKSKISVKVGNITVYFALLPISQVLPNRASDPPGILTSDIPGLFLLQDYNFRGARISYPGWLNEIRDVEGINDPQIVASNGAVEVRFQYQSGGIGVFGFIPTHPLSDYKPAILEENYIENYSGTFLAQKTTNAYIYQHWIATQSIKVDRFGKEERILTEITNTLTFKAGKNLVITLNNSDFLIISSWDSLSPITKDSASFTLTVSQAYKKDFNASTFIGEPILFGKIIDKYPALIKGTIVSASYSPAGVLTIDVAISKIILKTYTSFLGRLITDNGSYYSYHFRKNTSADMGAFISKSILKVIPLNPIVSTFFTNQYIAKLNKVTGSNLQTDNIVSQKIYSVVNVSGNKAWVEEWNILADGKIKYNKVFITPYCKIPENSAFLNHSFYP